MTITRITTHGTGGRVTRVKLVDTDRLGYKAKDIFKRIDEANEIIDRRITRLSVRLCDILG
jgi:hypothetical protein